MIIPVKYSDIAFNKVCDGDYRKCGMFLLMRDAIASELTRRILVSGKNEYHEGEYISFSEDDDSIEELMWRAGIDDKHRDEVVEILKKAVDAGLLIEIPFSSGLYTLPVVYDIFFKDIRLLMNYMDGIEEKEEVPDGKSKG